MALPHDSLFHLVLIMSTVVLHTKCKGVTLETQRSSWIAEAGGSQVQGLQKQQISSGNLIKSFVLKVIEKEKVP